MNSTTDVRGALRDLFQLKFGSYAWVPRLFVAIAVGAFAVLLSKIFSIQPGICNVPTTFRTDLAYTAVICWAVSTICVYAGGFVMGRLYVPRA